LTAKPTSTATTALVTRGPVTASRILRLTVPGRQSISTMVATAPLYSLCTAMPCAIPLGSDRPHLPTSAALFSTASVRASFRYSRRNASGSLPIAAASWSTISSVATQTLGE
jgi:hypothetical protein